MPHYGDIVFLNFGGKITHLDFSQKIHVGNDNFDVEKKAEGGMTILKYLIR